MYFRTLVRKYIQRTALLRISHIYICQEEEKLVEVMLLLLVTRDLMK